jgi:hypothetical protein
VAYDVLTIEVILYQAAVECSAVHAYELCGELVEQVTYRGLVSCMVDPERDA